MAAVPSGSLGSLREGNRRRVIDALRANGLQSRADIARHTGLSPSTVSTLVSELQSEGVVVERELDSAPRPPEGGRPPVLLAIDRSAGALVGLDFAHRHLRVAVSDLSYGILGEKACPLDIDSAAHAGLDTATAMVFELLEELGVPQDRVLCAGMGLSVPIDHETGMLKSDTILPDWVGLDPAAEMRERLDVPVHVDNDANVGALGELTFGAGQGHSVMAYLRLSEGIGAGLVIEGRLFRGAQGIAGEIGHVLVDPDGLVCRCGNRGCLETLVAGPALCDMLQRSHGEMTVDELLERAADGDAACRRVISDAGRFVGRATADLCNYLNPGIVVVGGELAAAGDLLLSPMRDAVRRFAVPPAAAGVEIVAGTLGERAEVLGALALAGQEARDPLVLTPHMNQPSRRST